MCFFRILIPLRLSLQVPLWSIPAEHEQYLQYVQCENLLFSKVTPRYSEYHAIPHKQSISTVRQFILWKCSKTSTDTVAVKQDYRNNTTTVTYAEPFQTARLLFRNWSFRTIRVHSSVYSGPHFPIASVLKHDCLHHSALSKTDLFGFKSGH